MDADTYAPSNRSLRDLPIKISATAKPRTIEEMKRSFGYMLSEMPIPIPIPEEDLAIISKHAQARADAKEQEHVEDNQREFKRNLTGLLGEYIVLRKFGHDWKKHLDTEIVNNSLDKDHADLKSVGRNEGVKTARLSWPIPLSKAVYIPQHIVLIGDDNKNGYYMGMLLAEKFNSCLSVKGELYLVHIDKPALDPRKWIPLLATDETFERNYL